MTFVEQKHYANHEAGRSSQRNICEGILETIKQT